MKFFRFFLETPVSCILLAILITLLPFLCYFAVISYLNAKTLIEPYYSYYTVVRYDGATYVMSPDHERTDKLFKWKYCGHVRRLSSSGYNIEKDHYTNNPEILSCVIWQKKENPNVIAIWNESKQYYSLYIRREVRVNWIYHDNALYAYVPGITSYPELSDHIPDSGLLSDALVEMPDSFVLLGNLIFCNSYEFPDAELETNYTLNYGKKVYSDPGYPDYLFVEQSAYSGSTYYPYLRLDGFSPD